jgi:hypothetical protein
MRVLISGFGIGALLICCTRSAGQAMSGQAKPEQPPALTLTNVRPVGYFLLAPETIATAPPVLAVKVTKVVNPDKTPFQLFVYLSCDSASGTNERQRLLIGNFGFFPSDKPGGHLLRASGAFHQLKTTSCNSRDVRLLFEMKRLYEANPWTTVELTIAPPEWKPEPTN